VSASLLFFHRTDCITERERLENIKALQERLETAKYDLEVAQRQGEYERASRLRYATIPSIEADLAKAEPPEGGIHDRVTADDIARVVARATGIPVQNLLKGERERLNQAGLKSLKLIFALIVIITLHRCRTSSKSALLDKITS
jgi:ATP-dependent Clp protease ATP-binding subunit ClpA